MKTDFYTKAVLTVIAVCLVVIVLRDLDIVPKANALPAVYAAPAPSNVMDVRIVDVSRSAAMSVNVESVRTDETFKVKLTGVDSYTTLPVSIEKLGSFLNPLPVEVKK